MPSTLYILYNANGSILGKFHYGYRKLTAPKDKPVCAACDITHGGLHLDETTEWKETKAEITKTGDVEVKQLHRDEMTGELRRFVEEKQVPFPVVLLDEQNGALKVVMDSQELASCGGDAQQFVAKMREKGVL